MWGGAADLGAAIAEERYENDVLYPKMIADVDPETAAVLGSVVERQHEHLRRLERLRGQVQGVAGRRRSPVTRAVEGGAVAAAGGGLESSHRASCYRREGAVPTAPGHPPGPHNRRPVNSCELVTGSHME